tara:strand:- start:3543 stop:4871 length:1329 start_codon:yes stop_codon:yes gene_type:complete
MPTTTFSSMRQDILRPMGLVTGTVTTNLSSSNASVIDSLLTRRFSVNDYFNNRWFVQITSQNNAGQIRRLTDYVGSSGTLTAAGANWSADSSGATYELSAVDPSDVLSLYNEAREQVFPDISLIRDLETAVTGNRQHTYTVSSTMRRIDRVYLGNRRTAESGDNLLLNGDFEDWSSTTAVDNFAIAGSGASVHQEVQTTNPENYGVLYGDNSARVLVPSSVVTTLLQTYDSTSSSYTAVATEGQECNLSAWVYCTTASRVSLYIGSALSATHSGTGWELLKGSANLSATATSIAVGISVSSGAAIPVFVDEIWMILGQSEMSDVPYTELRNWEHVPPVAGASDGGVLRFSEILPDKKRIRIVGRDMLSSVSADSDTVEIDGELLHPLYDKVRQLVALRMAAADPSSNWAEMARQYEESYVRAVEGNLVKVKSPPVAVPRMVF